MDFVRRWSEASEIGAGRFVGWLGVSSSKFYDWRERYGRVNEHNGWVPRDFWLEDWEKQAIINFHLKNPLEGYRRLTFMMLDADIVAVSPSSVWRVLGQEGLLKKWNGKPSKKGTGFEQPPQPHQHWHIDVSYINISGTFYYLCSVLDGYSRFIVHWDLRESMTEAEIEIILQGAKEKYPEAKPRIISDNGPQFIARDFKEFIRISGMTHVRTSPYYPQSNGKLERWHKSLKSECIRPGTPLTAEDARRLIQQYVDRSTAVFPTGPPQAEQFQKRTASGRESATAPQAEHCLLDGNQRSIRTNVRPYHSLLYCNWRTNSPQLESPIAPASAWFVIMPRTFKSSTVIVWFSRIRRVESWCRSSRRISVIFWWILATRSFALLRLRDPFCFLDSAFWARFNCAILRRNGRGA